MENFIFENSTKAYFGKGCVSQYLPNLLSQYGKTVMVPMAAGPLSGPGFTMKSWRS